MLCSSTCTEKVICWIQWSIDDHYVMINDLTLSTTNYLYGVNMYDSFSRHVCHKSLTCLWGSRPWQPNNYLFCRLLMYHTAYHWRLFGQQGIVLDNITLLAPYIVASIGPSAHWQFASEPLFRRLSRTFSYILAMREKSYRKNLPTLKLWCLRGKVPSCGNCRSNSISA